MTELACPLPKEISAEKVESLEKRMLEEQQVDCPVTHKFGPGIYIREVFLPAGTYVVGHHHNYDHMNVMLTGRIKFFGSDNQWTELKAPQTFVSAAGRKVAFVHEDTIWQNIYSTDEKDPDKLEKELLSTSMTFEESQKYNGLQLTYNHVEDFEDYYNFLTEFGITHEVLKQESEDQTDQIDFPYGDYRVQVKDSRIEGKGLFATASFEEGDAIAPARIDGMRTPAGRYINHSKKPNAFFVIDEQNNVFAVAGRNIIGYRGGIIGEEITVDYRQAIRLSEKD